MVYVVVVEHLNHLGIVAEFSREIGVAEWLDAPVPSSRQRVTVAMMLNGLCFSSTTGDAMPPQLAARCSHVARTLGDMFGLPYGSCSDEVGFVG